MNNTNEKLEAWKRIIPLLQTQSDPNSRATIVQCAIAEIGPCPDGMAADIRHLMRNESPLMPRTTISQVREFHEAFGHPIKDKPDLSNNSLTWLRVSLIQEELRELADAVLQENKVEVLDALLDLQYVLDGAFLALGFASVKDRAFAEVHRSNMSKLGADGKPVLRHDGKILKGPNYSEPDLRRFV